MVASWGGSSGTTVSPASGGDVVTRGNTGCALIVGPLVGSPLPMGLRKLSAKVRRLRKSKRVEEAPMSEAQASDLAAVPTWEEIVENHSDRVYRLAYRLTGNRHDAEDLTQEVFVRVFR